MKDIIVSDYVQVEISADGKRLWVNIIEEGCVLRINKVEKLQIDDHRKNPKERSE